jgi:lysine 2,3-aminomutase
MPDGFATPKSPGHRRAIRDVGALIEAGLAPAAARAALDEVEAKYAIAIPQALQDLMETPDDPIGRQFIPHAGELITAPHESADPIADEKLSPIKGIVHRYPDRALLKPLLACPVYCRFCFRREQVGPDGGVLTPTELEAAYHYIATHGQIREVILTGGDPLILSPRRLKDILRNLSNIPHVEVLRIHTRAPIADPGLITDELADALDIAAPLFIALHANHEKELTPAVVTAVQKLQRLGIPILGQTVLLAGVNDSEAALANLFRAMLRARIKPYYLHQLDAAPGTSTFHVPPEKGRQILTALRGKISGTAIPTYIHDRPNGLGKVPL